MAEPDLRGGARKLLGAAVVVLGALLAPGLGSAEGQNQTFGLNAALDARQVVPAQSVPAPAATGSFSATLEVSGTTARITWRLTFTHLSGRALQAHIHRGKLGKTGPIAIRLCGPCRTTSRGSAAVSAVLLRAIKSSGAYVEVHTKQNPRGEIRGQIRLLTGA
jgi:hypothetical protein